MKMNRIAQIAAITAGIGLALGASTSAMAVVGHYISSNGPDKCAAFTPGVTNTVRNRVSGAQNVGGQPIAVACVFELDEIYNQSTVTIDTVRIYFLNDNAGAVDVTCTLLPGVSGLSGGFGTAVTQTVSVAGTGGTNSVSYSGPWDVYGMGVNCTLPSNVTIFHTVIRYQNDGADG